MSQVAQGERFARLSHRFTGAVAFYLLAAALGITTFALAAWGWQVSRRLESQVTRAALEHAELLAREYTELARLVSDAAASRVFGSLQDGEPVWTGDIPLRIERALARAHRGEGGPLLPGSGGTFAWRSDRPERLEARGVLPVPADGLRRQIALIASSFSNERAAPVLVKADADGREILVSTFFRDRGGVVQVAGYVTSPRAFADSILIPIANRTTRSRYGDPNWPGVAWRVIQPGGDTLVALGAFSSRDRLVAVLPFRQRFHAESTPAESSPAAAPAPGVGLSRVTTRLDPRRHTYRLEVQVHPEALGDFLYGSTLAPAVPITVLFTFAMLLTVATIALARRLVRHVQEREAFATAVAHDLRTPLTQILLYGESLQLDRPAVHTREEAARVIVRETRRLIHMVENALQFVRGGRAQPTLSLEDISVGSVVRETVESMSPILARAAVSVSVEGVQDVQVVADRNALVQVLTNLIDNAVRFGPAGQTITLSLETIDGFGCIQVDDQGPGISPELREEVFRPFVRAGRSPGAGIGLAVSRQLAELMDGSLAASEAPSGGARLILRLPLSC